MAKKLDIYIFHEGAAKQLIPTIKHKDQHTITFDVPVLMECEMVNRNIRMYPWSLVDTSIEHDFIKERLATSTWYCECGHPAEKNLQRQLLIDRDLSACMIKSITKERPYIRGTVQTLATARGRDLRDLILYNNAVVGFSMRSVGKVVEENGHFKVVPPLFIVNFDEVVHPSVKTAYMDCSIVRGNGSNSKATIMKESTDIYGSEILLTENMLQECVLNESTSADILDWLEVNAVQVQASYSPRTNTLRMYTKLNEDNITIVQPNAMQIKRNITDYLSQCDL